MALFIASHIVITILFAGIIIIFGSYIIKKLGVDFPNKWILLLSLIIVSLSLFTLWEIDGHFLSKDELKEGALFEKQMTLLLSGISAASFLGVIFSIYSQFEQAKKEREQRIIEENRIEEELKARTEEQKTALEQETEKREIERDQRREDELRNNFNSFEDRFFQLLAQQRDILSKLVYHVPKEENGETKFYKIEGIDFLKKLKGEFVDQFDENKDQKEAINNTYKKLFGKYDSYLGNYFRHLYHILKVINNQEVIELVKSSDDSEKVKEKYKGYADLLQAQMSFDELFLCFYNALFFPKARRFMLYYGFLENLSVDHFISTDEKKKLEIDNHLTLFNDNVKETGLKELKLKEGKEGFAIDTSIPLEN